MRCEKSMNMERDGIEQKEEVHTEVVGKIEKEKSENRDWKRIKEQIQWGREKCVRDLVL